MIKSDIDSNNQSNTGSVATSSPTTTYMMPTPIKKKFTFNTFFTFNLTTHSSTPIIDRPANPHVKNFTA